MIQLGVLVLLATSLAVLFSVLAFALERDGLYPGASRSSCSQISQLACKRVCGPLTIALDGGAPPAIARRAPHHEPLW